MRVLCIDAGKSDRNQFGDNLPFIADIVEGEHYTVINKEEFFNEQYYQLSEMPSSRYYNSKLFIPLSDIDERDIAYMRELEEELQD